MKTKTYNFKEFINKDHNPTTKPPTMSLIPLATAPLLHTITAHAAEASIQSKMMAAFTPIIDLIQAMAYPVAMIVVLGGATMLMVGHKEKGFTMMQTAGMGYVIVMVAPMILDVLVDAMKGISN